MEASKKTKVLKNVVDKKPRKNSTGVISVWTGLEREKTEPNQTEKFLVRFQNKKKIGLVVYFGPKSDGTENAQPYLRPSSFSLVHKNIY